VCPIEPDAHILPGTSSRGRRASRVAQQSPDTTLRDCEIGENATVTRTDATLAVIEANATVGPFSYLRRNSPRGWRQDRRVRRNQELADWSRRQQGSALSYIGDSTVGENSNIGAGTITANYDGVAKHPTVIGSHVRTGSHNVFVAPVTICGRRLHGGRNQSVRRNVPAGSLGMTVVQQRNVEGWVKNNRPGTASAEAATHATKESELVR